MSEVRETVERAVAKSLEGKTKSQVLVEPTIDSYGQDALAVTVILDDADLSGAESLRMLVAIQDALVAAGDERFPIIDVTTESELALDGDPQP